MVTVMEFKTNFGKYLDMVSLNEDVSITKNGKMIAKMVNPNVSAVDALSGILAGKLPEDFDMKKMREERLEKYALND